MMLAATVKHLIVVFFGFVVLISSVGEDYHARTDDTATKTSGYDGFDHVMRLGG